MTKGEHVSASGSKDIYHARHASIGSVVDAITNTRMYGAPTCTTRMHYALRLIVQSRAHQSRAGTETTAHATGPRAAFTTRLRNFFGCLVDITQLFAMLNLRILLLCSAFDACRQDAQ